MGGQTSLTTYAAEGTPTEYEFSDFSIARIARKAARTFIVEHHYSGGCGSAMMPWGLYHDPTGELLGVIAFHTPISENTRASIFEVASREYGEGIASWNQCECPHIEGVHGFREHVTELHRMAIVDRAPPNTATWFISRALAALKRHKPKYWAVISLADSTVGHDGTVYRAANADYYGTSGERWCFRDQGGRLRHARQGGDRISLAEARDRGWERVKQDVKHRYVFWLPDAYRSSDRLPSNTKAGLRQMATVELEEF